jgi:uncharacterized protein (TIGR02217 family)
MSNAIFPSLAGLEYPVTRTPVAGKTLIQTSVSGLENRVALWSAPRWRWTLSFNFLRDDSNDEFRTLLAFFLARQGSYDSFLFDDPDDNAVAGQPLGVGDGVTTAFQLVRSLGGYAEPVLAPHALTAVSVGGASIGSAFAVDPNGGVLTLAAAPAAGATVAADFTYYWPVRFMTDEVDFAKFMNRLWEQKKLDFISLKNWP